MFKPIPFLKLFLPLSIGIILATFFDIHAPFWLVIISFIAVLFVQIIANKQRSFIPIFSVVFLLFILSVSVYRTNYTKTLARTSIENDENAFVIGQIEQEPKVFDQFIRTNLEIVAVKNKQAYQQSQGKSLLMIEKDSLALNLKKGDYIVFEPNFKDIESQKNPEAFNYKRYLFFHLISQKAYLKSKQWHQLPQSQHWYDFDKLAQLRQYLLQKYKTYGIDNNELSVLSALTLGYKNELEYSIQKSYAASGAIHVLAVSGLHVGIVFMIFSKLFSFLQKGRYSRLLRFILVLLSIWFFALLTGGAPSVLRASLMFSFMAFGQMLKRPNSIYNSIFASAFLLLLYRPFLLFDLSFQLSYSAVISIVYFQPKISAWFNPKFWVVKKLWDLTSVSLAAQIATFPITIFYFHQFPNYFLISNFIVIPMASIIIWGSLLFFASLSLPIIAAYLAIILKFLVKCQNFLIQQIENLPMALSENLYIDQYQLVLLVLLVLSLMLLSYQTKFRRILTFGFLLLTFTSYSQWSRWEKSQQKKLIVYNIKGETAINLIDGEDHILISSMAKTSKEKDFNMKEHWLSLGLNQEKHLSTKSLSSRFALSHILKSNNPNYYSKDHFIQFFDKRIVFIQNYDFLDQLWPKKLHVDYVIIGKNTKIDIAKLKLYFTFKQVIIDSSHSKRNLEYWQMQKRISPKIRIHIVQADGAFVEDIGL